MSHIVILNTAVLHKTYWPKILQLRERVFLREQQLTDFYCEDACDLSCWQLAAIDHEQLVGHCRLCKTVRGNFKLERVCVADQLRHQGIGRQLLQAAEGLVQEHGGLVLYLFAQSKVVPFYLSLGYSVCSSSFEHYGLLHVVMKKGLGGKAFAKK